MTNLLVVLLGVMTPDSCAGRYQTKVSIDTKV